MSRRILDHGDKRSDKEILELIEKALEDATTAKLTSLFSKELKEMREKILNKLIERDLLNDEQPETPDT